MKTGEACPESVLPPPPPEFLARLHEEEQSRRRPPGIDDWCNAIAAAAGLMLDAMPCLHETLDCTYVIQAEGGGLVKIGRAQSVRQRLVEIQTASPVRLDIVAIVRGPEFERTWHVQFYKLRRHREWFAPEVAQFFQDNGAPGCVRCALFNDKVGDRPPPRLPKRRRP
jgi:hypothetical protein